MEARTGKLQHIKVDELKPSPWNRAEDGNGEMKELAASIKDVGVLQPLIVRKFGSEGDKISYEIVAGHRRWRACKSIDRDEVPCVVVSLNDEEAKLTQITENLHRKNLNPMEEARAFHALWKDGVAGEAQRIAEMVGKDAKYVYRSLELLKLPKRAQEALEKGLISAAHGHQIARVGPKQIDSVVAYAVTPGYKGEIVSLQSLKDFINKNVAKDLAHAPWDKGVPYAGKMACVGCPSNSANQELLFDGAAAGTCTNGPCYLVKMKQFYKDLQAKGQERWPYLQFVGSAMSGYGPEIIKGYKVVDPSILAVKKAMEAAKEQVKKNPDLKVAMMGFGIMKPSRWGSLRQPKLVILARLDPKKDQGGYQRDPDQEYYWQFMRDYEAEHCAEVRKLDEQARKLREKIMAAAKKEWSKNKKTIIEAYKAKEAK